MDALRQYRRTEGVASAPGAIPACRVKTAATRKDNRDREAHGTNDSGFKVISSNSGATKGVNNANNGTSAKRSTVTSSWLRNDQSRLEEMTEAVAAGNQSAVEMTKEADAIDQSAIELTKETDPSDQSSVAMTGKAAARKYIRKRESYMIQF
jgi:hypothetical protein